MILSLSLHMSDRRVEHRIRAGSLLSESGVLIESSKEKADEFNRYFSSVFSRENLGDVPLCDGRSRGIENGLEQIVITEERVRKVLRSLRGDKSPGVDGIGPRLLVHIQDEVCLPISILFNKSMSEGKVPEDWRRANIVPIFKAGSRNKPENFRPVSLTSQVCKLFESLMREDIVDHLERNGLLNISQHGFRKGRSCLTNLLSFLEEVTEKLDARNSIDVVYLDFAKAFDKVPHRRLINKVRSFGIGGELLRWIECWLTDRLQRVGCEGAWSDWRRVLSGIPQGSVLGPILFLMFIDDLDEGLTSRILKFADDTKIFRVVNGPEDRNALQEDLGRLSEWSEIWQMKFNVDKCKVMHLGPKNMHWNYSMGGRHLKEATEEKDLGVIITNDLKVEAQCSAACIKANRMLGLIRRTVVNKRRTILTTLYKSLVRPHLEYSTAAWSPHYVKDREMLERVQRRFTRMVPGLGELEYGERLGVLGLMTLEERRNRSDMVEMYKVLKGLSAIPRETFFELNGSGRTRGNSLKIVKKVIQTDIRKFFFSQRVINRWNALDERVVAAETVDAFKKRLHEDCEKKMGLLTGH